MKIPVLPMSYADALPLLSALEGPVAPPAWRGALPITYHIGPGPASGACAPGVQLGSGPGLRRDCTYGGLGVSGRVGSCAATTGTAGPWGAGDPTSGHVALMEEARVIGELAKTGWRPKRTILYGSWDARRAGSAGFHGVGGGPRRRTSGEDGRLHQHGRDRAWVPGDGGIPHAREVHQRGGTRCGRPADGRDGLETIAGCAGGRREARRATRRPDLRISPLGSGSDYTPFLQHLGVASLNLGFGGESGGGSYHSQFDSYDHYTRFGDPGFQYGVALVKTAGAGHAASG